MSRQNHKLGPAWESKSNAIADLFVIVIALTSQKAWKFINFCLKVGHSANLKHSKYRWRQLIVLSEMYKIITSKALGNRGTGTVYDNCRFDIKRFRAEPTNYEWCLHPSDTFAYRSAHNNLFLTLRVIHKLKTWKKRCHQMLLQCWFL